MIRRRALSSTPRRTVETPGRRSVGRTDAGGTGLSPDAAWTHLQLLSLQRAAGNAAVTGLIFGASKPATAPGAMLAVQRRGNRRATKFATANWTGLPTTRTHLMEGEVEGDEPKGLHAYDKGALSVEVVHTVGNQNSVHFIWWTDGSAKTKKKAKWSTMFPLGMTEGMVTAVLHQSLKQTNKTVDTAKMGLGFGAMTIKTLGADEEKPTMFPYKDPPAAAYQKVVNGYTVTKPAKK